MDVDLYSSYKDCLEFFFPKLVKGGIVTFDEYTVDDDLKERKGWNLIGSSYDCELDDLDNIIIPNTTFEYDNTSYNKVSKIKENKGLWLKCKKSGTITLNKLSENYNNEIMLKEGWNLQSTFVIAIILMTPSSTS